VELEQVIDMANAHGLALATVTGDVDLSTPTGRLVARIVGTPPAKRPSTRPNGRAASAAGS
jgi:hypothetical protein